MIDQYLPSIFDFLLFPLLLSLSIIIAGILILKIILRPFQKTVDSYADFLKKISTDKFSTEDIHTNNGYFFELNESFENLKSELIKRFDSSEDKEKLQHQIKEMLRIVNNAANGDFTDTAQVTADTLGVLADSFNSRKYPLSV